MAPNSEGLLLVNFVSAPLSESFLVWMSFRVLRAIRYDGLVGSTQRHNTVSTARPVACCAVQQCHRDLVSHRDGWSLLKNGSVRVCGGRRPRGPVRPTLSVEGALPIDIDVRVGVL